MGCEHDCSSCGANCQSKNKDSFIVETNKRNNIKKIIAVHSGKGGVGKSFVTCMLATVLAKKGYKVGILDADITGPSIPESFGVGESRAEGDGESLNPVVTDSGIQLMSMNFLLQNENDPVIWRGPVISGAVQQFWTDVNWKDVDFMFVDMPPGTGDVPLTVFQSLPIDGIIVVSSPQQLVRVIVEKAVKMASLMNIPILGLVENMSYVKCPDCGKEISVFGKSNIQKIAESFNIPVLARLPMEESTSAAVDAGDVESLNISELDQAGDVVEKLIK